MHYFEMKKNQKFSGEGTIWGWGIAPRPHPTPSAPSSPQPALLLWQIEHWSQPTKVWLRQIKWQQWLTRRYALQQHSGVN